MEEILHQVIWKISYYLHGFFTSQVVQDFFQQQYAPGEHVLQLRDSFEGIIPLLVGNPYEPPF